MPRTRWDCLATFFAVDDAGKRYRLRNLIEMVETTDSSGTQWKPGCSKIETDDGSLVSRRARGEYVLAGVLIEETILRSTDPNAV